MNKKRKSGLLILLLAGPLFIYTAFHLFGTNHYDVPYYHSVGFDEKGDTLFYPVPSTTLNLHNGTTITTEEFEDNLVVVNFFKGEIGDSSVNMIHHIPYLQFSFRNHPEVNFLSIYTDEVKDAGYMEEYYNYVEAKEGRWYVATPGKDKAMKLANEVYKMSSLADTADGNTLLLIDRNGYIRGVFSGDDEDDVEELLSVIRILKYEQF